MVLKFRESLLFISFYFRLICCWFRSNFCRFWVIFVALPKMSLCRSTIVYFLFQILRFAWSECWCYGCAWNNDSDFSNRFILSNYYTNLANPRTFTLNFNFPGFSRILKVLLIWILLRKYASFAISFGCVLLHIYFFETFWMTWKADLWAKGINIPFTLPCCYRNKPLV